MRKAVFIQLASAYTKPEEVERIHALEFEAIRATGTQLDVACIGEYDEKGFVEACRGHEMVLCGGNPPMNSEVVAQLTDSRLFIRYGIGINSIDMDACTKHGKLVYYMPGYCAQELAQHALSMILSLLRNTTYYDREMRKGHFAKAGGPMPRRLGGLTVGLFGLGSSARELARILKNGFQTRLIACDPFITKTQAATLGIEVVGFEALLREADIISIHAPLTPETHHQFGMRAFDHMKSDALIINTSRGALIDTDALTQALRSGRIGGAGLDVFEKEPTDASLSLLEFDNVVLTPHSAYYGKESVDTQHQLARTFALAWLSESAILPRYIANKAVLTDWLLNGGRVLEEED